MEKLYQLIETVTKFNDVWIARETFTRKDVQEFIIFLNTRGQLFDKRIDSKGELLPTYSKTTEIISGGRKKEGEHFTLLDKGDFYESFFVTVASNGDIDINANTLKVDIDQIVDLLDIASPYIIGLTNESKEKLADFSKKVVEEIIRKEITNI